MSNSEVQTYSISSLEELVDELMKNEPEERRLRRLMDKNGIPYSSDPFERLNSVLMALQFELPAKSIKE